MEKGGPMAGAVPPDRLMFGFDCQPEKVLVDRYAAAMEAQGYGPHFEKIFYSNGRAMLDRMKAI